MKNDRTTRRDSGEFRPTGAAGADLTGEWYDPTSEAVITPSGPEIPSRSIAGGVALIASATRDAIYDTHRVSISVASSDLTNDIREVIDERIARLERQLAEANAVCDQLRSERAEALGMRKAADQTPLQVSRTPLQGHTPLQGAASDTATGVRS